MFARHNTDFYIHLPSNVEGLGNKKNHPSDYSLILNQHGEPLELSDEWEVGLSELFVPEFYHSVTEDMVRGMAITKTRKNGEQLGETFKTKIIVPPGFYTPDEFCRSLARAMKKKITPEQEQPQAFAITKFHFDPRTQKISGKLGPYEKLDLPSDQLRYILGLPEKNYRKYISNITGEKKYVTFPYEADFLANVRLMYVYSDIVEFSFVGNVMAPILRVVCMKTSDKSLNNMSNQVYYKFTPVQFHSLSSNRINRIDIRLRDSAGNHIVFPQGNSLAVLQFRKKL
jgi:hypothetical protein